MAKIIDEGESFGSTPPLTINADGNPIEITDAVLLQGVDIGSLIDFIFDELGTQSTIVSA